MTHKKTLKYEVYNYSHSNGMLHMSEYKINGSAQLGPSLSSLLPPLPGQPPYPHASQGLGNSVGTKGPLSRCTHSVSRYWDDWDIRDGDCDRRDADRGSPYHGEWGSGGCLALINPKSIIHVQLKDQMSVGMPCTSEQAGGERSPRWPRWKMQRKTSTAIPH